VKKSTAIAPSNIAFTKYWGRKDEKLRLPMNGSIAMCLSNLLTTTTVEFDEKLKKDDITINDERREKEALKVSKHLDRIRKLAGINIFARVVSENNFPTGTGLSSSASGFAALTVAGANAAGLNLSEKELSVLARQGSGSACRSIPGGIVEWLDGDTSETSFAKTIFEKDHWDIADVVAVVSEERKEVSTSEAHESANTSPFMNIRVEGMKAKNELLKKIIKQEDFQKFGELIESEALELHAIYITQKPSLIYLLPNSILIMKLCKKWREEGLPVYFTVNTGQDIHLIVEKKNIKKLEEKLRGISEVKQVIVNYPGDGTKFSDKPLF
jgi:diphosphomevalonate decarboxylase